MGTNDLIVIGTLIVAAIGFHVMGSFLGCQVRWGILYSITAALSAYILL